MKKVLKWLGILIGAFFIIIIIASIASSGGKSSTSTATSTKLAAKPLPSVGEFEQKGNWEVSLLKAERQKALKDLMGKDVVPQGQFLSILATVKNVGKQTYLLNSHDFNILAPGDIKYTLASQIMLQEIPGYKTVWLNVEVQPSLSQKVRLIFDVPPGISGLTWDVQGIRFAIPD